MHRDIYNQTMSVLTVVPVLGKTTITGVYADLKGFYGALVQVHFGDSGDTLAVGLNVTPKLQESDASGSGFTDVASAHMLGAFTIVDAPTEDQCIQEVGYIGYKRYLRVLLTFVGTHTNGIPIAASVVKGLPEDMSTR